MKKKMFLLPLLALMLGLASAFTTMPSSQMAWYKDTSVVPPVVQQGAITTPEDTEEQPCAIGRQTICRVGGFFAHSTQGGAASDNPLTLLKYD